MEKKYVKIIKHLYKNLQKKDEFKNEFERVSDKIFFYLLGSSSFVFFILLSFIFGIGAGGLFASLVLGIVCGFAITLIVMLSKFNIFNNFASKKLSKYNLFNLYGRSYEFHIFLSNIMKDIIDKTEKEDIKPYIKEINHVINSIPEESIKDNVKMKLIKKMEIDIDNQLISLIENKTEENLIKIDCKEIVVNN